MPARIPNVVRRNGAYYFRRCLPKELRLCLRRRELTFSLRTGDPIRARALSRRLYLLSEEIFARIDKTSMFTNDQLAKIAQCFYETVLEEENNARLRSGSIEPHVRDRKIAHYEQVAANAKESLALNEFDDSGFCTRVILSKLKLNASDEFEFAQAAQAINRAGIELSQTIIARLNGDFNYEPRDQLLKMALASVDLPDDVTLQGDKRGSESGSESKRVLSDLAKHFIEQQKVAGRWDPQTAHQSRKSFELFESISGDRPLQNYGRRDAARYKDILERMPADYGKDRRFRGLTPDEILETDSRRPTPMERLSTRTVKRHITALSTLWSDAAARGLVTENIFSGFKFARQALAQEQRQMWETADLMRLFATPVWSGCKSESRRSTPGHLIIRDEKFWLPLIAVFSGLRQEEICQLHVSDIKAKDGIYFLDINDEPPRKLKNRSSVRLVPVHSELIRLGFIEHVRKQENRNHARIFPDLNPGGADKRLGHGFTKWFSRYRQETGLYKPGLDFHSFRHSATTFMHRAGVIDSLVDRITGHVTPGETARYTKSSDLIQLRDAIERISIGFSLGHLYPASHND